MLRTPSNREEMYVDIGVYGIPQRERFEAEKTTRRLEEFVRKIGGFQMMYADSFMSREEFRAMFDHTLYDRSDIRNSHSQTSPEKDGNLIAMSDFLLQSQRKTGMQGEFPGGLRQGQQARQNRYRAAKLFYSPELCFKLRNVQRVSRQGQEKDGKIF